MTRTQIRLDTLSNVNKFVEAMSKLPDQIWLEDGSGSRVNAKSTLGVLYSMEFTRIYVFCERDINAHLMEWMV